ILSGHAASSLLICLMAILIFSIVVHNKRQCNNSNYAKREDRVRGTPVYYEKLNDFHEGENELVGLLFIYGCLYLRNLLKWLHTMRSKNKKITEHAE
ncbi:hypothetical protein EWB00_003279, partial [Schistosoma japonicum]